MSVTVSILSEDNKLDENKESTNGRERRSHMVGDKRGISIIRENVRQCAGDTHGCASEGSHGPGPHVVFKKL